MSVLVVRPQSKELAAVKKLWRPHSKTLGFFPDGAFDQYASEGHVLGIFGADGQCLAYTAFRTGNHIITLAHLCVAPNSRSQGLAKLLVNTVSDKYYKDFYGIQLTCRRDFEASNLWPLLGFVPRMERPGRNRAGKELTYWWRDHNHPDIWSEARREALATGIPLVLDANVFYDLEEPNATTKNEESKALLADWLAGSVVLCVTPEIRNEINRNGQPENRRRLWTSIGHYMELEGNHAIHETARRSLIQTIGPPATTSAESDYRQMAWALCCGHQFFITRDQGILDKFDVLNEKLGLMVLRPSDVIARLDALRREADYKPAQLSGTHVTIGRLQSREQNDIPPLFVNSGGGEKLRGLEADLHRYVSKPERYQIIVTHLPDKGPLSISVYDREENWRLKIPLFRVRKLGDAPVLSPTLTRHLILKALEVSANENRRQVEVCDPFLSADLAEILKSDGFASGIGYTKTTARFVGTGVDLVRSLQQYDVLEPPLADLLSDDNQRLDLIAAANIERSLWPAKVTDSSLPSWVVPIKPRWAQDLFDPELASQSLFGASEKLILNRESVYYRAKSPGGIKAPGRILWYVSQDDLYRGSKSIRACSQVDEVVVGKPKELFKEFRRLGVYSWQNVLDVAKGDIDTEIMAIRFSFTEAFQEPVPLSAAQEVICEYGGSFNNFVSPCRISGLSFGMLYKLGMRMPLQ